MKKILIFIIILFLMSCSSSLKISENKLNKQDTTQKNINKEIIDTVKNVDTSKFVNSTPVVDKLMTSPHIEESPNIEEPIIQPLIHNNLKSKKMSKKSNSNNKAELEINEGKLIYSIPDTMKLGNTYTITIRIKKNTNNVKIIDSLYNQKIVDIKVTNTMEVVIIDPSPNDSKNFNILKQNSDKQIIEDNDYTEWVYSVQPLKSGNLKLNIVVSIVKNDNLKQIVYFNNTYVRSDPKVVIQTFWEKYWQWFLSTIIIPFIVFIYKSRKKNND